jgi:hypothetical protein
MLMSFTKLQTMRDKLRRSFAGVEDPPATAGGSDTGFTHLPSAINLKFSISDLKLLSNSVVNLFSLLCSQNL